MEYFPHPPPPPSILFIKLKRCQEALLLPNDNRSPDFFTEIVDVIYLKANVKKKEKKD